MFPAPNASPDGFPHQGIDREIKSGLCHDAVTSPADYRRAFERGFEDCLEYLEFVVGTDFADWGSERLADLHHHQFCHLYRRAGEFRKLGEQASFGGRIGADSQDIVTELELLRSQIRELWESLPAFDSVGESVKRRLELLTFAHGRLVLIHPFPDGNGRVSRLASAWMERNLFPERRPFRAVPKALYMVGMRNLPGDIGPLMNWFAERIGLETPVFNHVAPPYPVNVTRR